METAIVQAPPRGRRATDQTAGVGAWPEPHSSTPLISQSLGRPLGAEAFNLAGGDVLVRLAGRDIIDRLLELVDAWRARAGRSHASARISRTKTDVCA